MLDPRDAKTFELDDGRLQLWHPQKDAIVTRAEGHGSRELLRFYTDEADLALQSSDKLYIFHHWAGITTWDPLVRDELRAWASQYGDRLAGTHFLVRSPLLAMAIEVAGLALGRKLHSHRSEAAFIAELTRVIGRRATERPKPPDDGES